MYHVFLYRYTAVTDDSKTPNHKSGQSNSNPAISLGGNTPRNHNCSQSNMTPPSTVLNLCPSPSIINSTGRKKCRFVLAPDTTPPAPDSVDVAIRGVVSEHLKEPWVRFSLTAFPYRTKSQQRSNRKTAWCVHEQMLLKSAITSGIGVFGHCNTSYLQI